MKKTIIFRADGNSQIGAGHIMRCISIANAAKDRGYYSIFVTAENAFQDIIEAHHHKNIVLNRSYRDIGEEVELYVKILAIYSVDVFFVDSYYVTTDYFTSLKRVYTGKIIYIDDMAQYPYQCDFLVNYNIYGSGWYEKYIKMYSHSSGMPLMLLGAQYAPLRSEFSCEKERINKEDANDILISTGGSDPEHFTLEIIDAIKRIRTDKIFHIVVGSLNEDKTGIYAAIEKQNNIIIHENVQLMSELMLNCDVAISAAGSTLYELCATQTPTITYILEDNQQPGADAFAELKVLMNCGDIRNMGPVILADKLIYNAINLCEDYDKRKMISRLQASIVDGKGASRIIDSVIVG